MGGGSRSGSGATERKSWRWQGVVARWHSLGGSAPLPRTTRGPGRVGEASRSQTRCLHRSKGSRPEAMLSRATCVTPSRPCLLPGPRYCHPLALRTRCSSSWPGLCVARRHKAGKRTSDARPREQEHCGGRDAGPQSTQPAPKGPRHKRRRVLSLAAAPLAPRPPAPPRPAAAPSPSPWPVRHRQPFGRPARLSGGPLTWSPRGVRGTGLGAEGMHVPPGKGLRCKQRGEDERGAGRRSWGGGEEGLPSSPPPHFLPGGIQPEGRCLAGDSASLCRRPRLLGTAAAAPILVAGPAVLLET